MPLPWGGAGASWCNPCDVARPAISALVCRRWYRCHVDVSGFLPPPAAAPAAQGGAGSGGGRAGAIPYIADASGMGAAEFEARFDGPGQPVLLGGLAAAWPGAALPWLPLTDAQAILQLQPCVTVSSQQQPQT